MTVGKTIQRRLPILDSILNDWHPSLGDDFLAYKNHCYRVANFCLALSSQESQALEKISVAVAFHDLGIWANGTYDYLGPSKQLAAKYLTNAGRDSWSEEIQAMIDQHHKITRSRHNAGWLVENFRKADWIDVTRGRLRFGLPEALVLEVLSSFPNAGFHRRLFALTKQRFKTHPWSPLPMMKL